MKIVCYKDTLLKALNSVIKGVASKTTNPILEGILIQTNENQVKLTTYDMELGIEYIIDSDVKEQGSTVVNAIMFSEIIRKLPDSEIYITLNSNNLLEIECEGSLYKLATMNPDEFPELPKINIDNSIEIEQTVLKNMIRKTIFAVSSEENRPIFAELRKLSVDIARKNAHNMSMSILSMGMTNDYEVAIEEGATMVRVGTAIFGARNYAQTNVR